MELTARVGTFFFAISDVVNSVNFVDKYSMKIYNYLEILMKSEHIHYLIIYANCGSLSRLQFYSTAPQCPISLISLNMPYKNPYYELSPRSGNNIPSFASSLVSPPTISSDGFSISDFSPDLQGNNLNSFSMSPFGLSAIEGASNVASSLINNLFARSNMKKQHELNEQSAENAYNRQLDFWEKQNAYNDPAAQADRLRAAGFSAVGQVSPGNAGGLSSTPQASVSPNSGPGVGPIFDLLSAVETMAHVDNLDFQNEKLGAETKKFFSSVYLDSLEAELKKQGKTKMAEEVNYLRKQIDLFGTQKDLYKSQQRYYNTRAIRNDAYNKDWFVQNFGPIGAELFSRGLPSLIDFLGRLVGVKGSLPGKGKIKFNE